MNNTLETLTVTIAANIGVALIQMPKGEQYSLARGREVRKENAPQRLNLHHDESCHTLEMEDKYPFAKVRHKLEATASQSELVHMLVDTMDTKLSDERRQERAKSASKIVRNYPKTIEFARKIMLLCRLPEESEIKDEIFGKLSQPLQELLQEVIAKWRP
ncbi:hypothetical protein CL630_01335 [bacterium]|nr:hypothetical protein [bacterium]|tara:strand:+ start:12057 stop:12536 length:480 start_codon:yes stop_codon:yes gene_type:complete